MIEIDPRHRSSTCFGITGSDQKVPGWSITENGCKELEDVEDVNARALELIEQGYRPHFHVWTPDEFRQSLADIAEAEKLPMTVVDSATNFREFMVVISKT